MGQGKGAENNTHRAGPEKKKKSDNDNGINLRERAAVI